MFQTAKSKNKTNCSEIKGKVTLIQSRKLQAQTIQTDIRHA